MDGALDSVKVASRDASARARGSAYFVLEHDGIPVNADVTTVAKAAVEDVRRMQMERVVRVEASGTPHALLDAQLILRVVENLVSNGLKHASPELPLRVEVSVTDEVRVAVHDHREGVPEERRQTIFERFGASKARGDRNKHSVGSGLAFCKLAVEAHGGRIGVDGELGKGSSLWFTVPTGPRAA